MQISTNLHIHEINGTLELREKLQKDYEGKITNLLIPQLLIAIECQTWNQINTVRT